MRKAVSVMQTRFRYFCDLCSEEVYLRYDNDIDELLKKCSVCGKMVCYYCRENYSNHVKFLDGIKGDIHIVCNICYEPVAHIVEQITQNCNEALKKERALYDKLIRFEK